MEAIVASVCKRWRSLNVTTSAEWVQAWLSEAVSRFCNVSPSSSAMRDDVRYEAVNCLRVAPSLRSLELG
jgi:hypothetical protein